MSKSQKSWSELETLILSNLVRQGRPITSIYEAFKDRSHNSIQMKYRNLSHKIKVEELSESIQLLKAHNKVLKTINKVSKETIQTLQSENTELKQKYTPKSFKMGHKIVEVSITDEKL